jgi:hypothetical protein
MPLSASNQEPEWSSEVLQLAAEEAASSGYSSVLPAHVLIGTCRFVDLTRNDLSDALKTTQRRLRREMEALSLDPQRFRRRLRGLIVKGQEADAAETLRRELAQYAAKHRRRAGLASGTGCAQATQALINRAAALAGPAGDNDGLHLLHALLLGDMEMAPASEERSPDNLPDRL